MKKIALLLALVFVFSVFAVACETENPDVSNASEAVSEGEASEETTKQFVLTGNPVGENPKSTIVSNGASYTKSYEADAAYADTYGTELTDGIRGNIVGGNYQDTTLSGYQSNINVVIDLGTVYDKLYNFSVGFLYHDQAGINPPSSIAVQASLDGVRWTRIGTLTVLPEFEDEEAQAAALGTVLNATYTSAGYIMAQYIRFDINNRGGWVFIDETVVVADVEGGENNVQYLEAVNSAYQTLGCVAKPTSDVEINRELDKVLISKGSSYTVNGTEKNFTDATKKMLTDGNISGYYEGGTWVGYSGESDTVITVDLGKTVTDIAAIEANFYTNTAIKIFLPVAVKIAALDEDKNRTELGILYGNTVIVNGDYCFSLPFDKAISARYIEYTFVATETNLFMIEEVGVYAYREVVVNKLYPPLSFEEGATDWGSDASSEYENLIFSKTQQIIAANEPKEENYANNTAVTSTFMTDGKLSTTTDIHNGRFFKFSNGGSRTVIYDLEHISAVDKFTASFVERTDWAVQRPAKVTVVVSPDGDNWYDLGRIELSTNAVDPSNAIYKGTLEISKAVNVRYVAFAFDVGAWVGCDELEVYGKKNSSGSSPDSLGYEVRSGFFSTSRIEPSEELLGGSKDLCLMYHSKDNYYVAEDLIPYLSYVDAEGKPQDVMFDSFLFLYNNSTFPSGGKPHTGGTMSDWQWTIDDLFTDGRNVMALEDAAGQVKTALGLADDYKFKYTVTLYYPVKFDDNGKIVAYNFGDVDGDGVPEDFTIYEDRVKVLQWYIDEVEKIVAEKNFKNIELVGYYWWHEGIENIDKESEQLLNDISDMVHETGKEFFWIPYFCSNGYNQWAEYGFDVACMQPNYVFRLEAPYSNVTNCAELTKLYGMGFEMEICEDALTTESFYKKYMEYLGSGATLGYMNDTIVMYYQSVYVFREAARSDSAMARNIYDQTYHFIKGDLNYNPDAITGLTFDTAKNTPVTCDIGFETDVLREFQVAVTPDHGSVTLNGDGTFTYYPEKDYTGEVKFSFVFNEYLGWSDPCEVTINVK